MKRLAEMQDWPLFWQREVVATFAAAARSADGITTNGSEPPSSRTTFLSTSPAVRATATPAASLPVRVAAATRSSRSTRVDLAAADQQGLEDVVGEARVAEQLLHEQRGLRHVAGVLEQPDVAGRQRRGGEPHRLPEREVPRHDRQHHADRQVVGVGLRRVDAAGVDRLVGQEARARGRRSSAAPPRTCRSRRPRPSWSCPSRASSARRPRRCACRGCRRRSAATRRAARGWSAGRSPRPRRPAPACPPAGRR